MRKITFSGMAALFFVISISAAMVLFKTSPASSGDLCFGYALCDQQLSK